MLGLPDLLSLLSKVEDCVTADLIDRLNFGVTVYILAFFALLTGSKQHFGNPIQCLAPWESSDSWVDYYHDYCFIQDKLKIKRWRFTPENTLAMKGGTTTYDSTQIIGSEDAGWMPTVVYYQWVPYVLFIQALLFLFPKLMWKFMGAFVCRGADVESCVMEAAKLRGQVGDDQGRESSLRALAKFITQSLEWKNKRSFIGHCELAICYALTKWTMAVNSMAQFYMLSHFIAGGDHLWGYKLLRNVWDKAVRDPTEGIFPRVVRCVVPQLENTGANTLNHRNMQCVLMLNFINEKIYTFLYFWFLFVCLMNLVAALRFTLFIVLPFYRNAVADSLLPNQDVLFASASALLGVEHTGALQGNNLLDFFIGNVLRTDGILLLLFINTHAGGLVTHDLAHQLWKLTVQPTFSIDGSNADLEFGLLPEKKENSKQVESWSYTKGNGLTGVTRGAGGADRGRTDERKPRNRFRSLSLGDVLREPLLPSAPSDSVSPPDSVMSQHNFDDSNSTLPLNETTLPKHQVGRGIALFDNRKAV